MFVYCLYQNNPHPISSNFNLRSWLHSCWRDNRTMVRSCDEEFIWIHITKQYKDTIVDLIYLCSKRAARWPCISVTYSIYMKYNKCTNILSVKKYIFSVISLYIPYKYATKLLEIFWVNSQLRLEEINTWLNIINIKMELSIPSTRMQCSLLPWTFSTLTSSL